MEEKNGKTERARTQEKERSKKDVEANLTEEENIQIDNEGGREREK